MPQKSFSSRRSFLKKSLTIGTGIMICDSRSVFTYEANEKLNMAFIGAGGRAGASFPKVAKENVVALCDVDTRQCVEARKKHPKAKFYHDFRKMLPEMDKEIDAVIVSTPDHTHAVASIAAIQQGKHVYCEKPLTRTVLEARALRLAAEKHKVVTQMGNQGTYSDGLRQATEWCWAGTAGPIREAYIWVGESNQAVTLPTGKQKIPEGLDWDLWQGPCSDRPYSDRYVPKGWRPWNHYGSGRLGDMGCHTANIAFRGLKLEKLWQGKDAAKNEIRFEGESKGSHKEGYPGSCRISIYLPSRGGLPPVKLVVSNGYDMRPPQSLLPEKGWGGYGTLLIGSQASVYSSDAWNRSSSIHPHKKDQDIKNPPVILERRVGHWNEWLNAIRGKGKPLSEFAWSGPLTELIQLANIAGRLDDSFTYDPINGKIPNNLKASELLHREYRKGWTL